MSRPAILPTRVDAVLTQLRQRIFEGKYPPGANLRELTLARELSVSQATVREALQRLEYNGLVTRRQNVGSTVTQLSPKDIRERVELRAVLEVKAALDAAPKMGDAEFAELEGRLRAFEAAVAADHYYESAQADLEFHRYVWQCSDNEAVCRHLELLVIPLFAFVSILRSQGLERLSNVTETHRPLIEALRSRETERIRQAFTAGATGAYQVFLGDGSKRAVYSALGYLAPQAK